VAALVAPVRTQEAADLLNVSPSHLLALLDSMPIPFRMAGADHRILAADLLACKEADDAQRKAVLDELIEEAEGHGLGY
jgi:excisionase family DNA binding protein